uniref:RNase H type-1 domain-containing protein n=1 Tax=Nicotiana tabacum TaxID=4097 RepID=A0A1S4BMI7_TOBAC|nr:PREDICTED: uncharacterized protein LOC107809871 [Nicotiana tabacum]
MRFPIGSKLGLRDLRSQSGSHAKICSESQALLARFREWLITHIPREKNTEVDALANLVSSTEMKGSDSDMVMQLMHSILDADDYYEVNATNLVWDWRNEIIDYLEHEKLPEDANASWALRTKVARYNFKGGNR